MWPRLPYDLLECASSRNINEVAGVKVAGDELSAGRTRAVLDDLNGLPLTRVAHARLIGGAWRLRHNISFYDAL